MTKHRIDYSVPLLGQERDRDLERIDVGLQQPPSLLRGIDPLESTGPTTFSIFTLVPPTGRGEMIRVAIPVGELVSPAFKEPRRRIGDAKRQPHAASWKQLSSGSKNNSLSLSTESGRTSIAQCPSPWMGDAAVRVDQKSRAVSASTRRRRRRLEPRRNCCFVPIRSAAQ
jgi:hypothetical protein